MKFSQVIEAGMPYFLQREPLAANLSPDGQRVLLALRHLQNYGTFPFVARWDYPDLDHELWDIMAGSPGERLTDVISFLESRSDVVAFDEVSTMCWSSLVRLVTKARERSVIERSFRQCAVVVAATSITTSSYIEACLLSDHVSLGLPTSVKGIAPAVWERLQQDIRDQGFDVDLSTDLRSAAANMVPIVDRCVMDQ